MEHQNLFLIPNSDIDMLTSCALPLLSLDSKNQQSVLMSMYLTI